MTQTFDVIVVGCGGVGSAVLDHLARRGVRVLGIEQFHLGHDRGSSHGRTRIIREAYFEHPNYVPLVRDSFELWRQLESDAGCSLLTPCGLLEIGPPEGMLIRGVTASAEQHGLRVDHFTAEEAQRQFAQFRIPTDCVGVFERDAGILHVDDCVDAHLRRAEQHGAGFLSSTTVRDWMIEGSDILVRTDSETLRSRHLVLTGGAWSGGLLRNLDLSLQVLLKRVYWFQPQGRADAFRLDQSCPIYYFELPYGHFYGFPVHDDSGLKTAEHSGGIELDAPDELPSIADVDEAELGRIDRFLSEQLPNVGWQLIEQGNCFYTMSADGHFVIDKHPASDNVLFVCGLSGHGFKFTPSLGRIVADVLLEQRWDERARFLRNDDRL